MVVRWHQKKQCVGGYFIKWLLESLGVWAKEWMFGVNSRRGPKIRISDPFWRLLSERWERGRRNSLWNSGPKVYKFDKEYVKNLSELWGETKRSTLRHTVINYQKSKTKRNLKAARQKHLVAYKESSIRLAADLCSETVRREGSEMTCLKYWKKNIVNQ